MLTDRAANRIIIIVLMAVATMMVRTCSSLEAMASQQVAESGHKIATKEITIMNEKITTWKFYIVEGVKAEHVVKTTREEGETNDEWAARHKAQIDADKVLFVPVN